MIRSTLGYAPRKFFPAVEGWPEASAHDHQEIIARLRDRDPDGAREAMAQHVRNAGILLAEHLAGQKAAVATRERTGLTTQSRPKSPVSRPSDPRVRRQTHVARAMTLKLDSAFASIAGTPRRCTNSTSASCHGVPKALIRTIATFPAASQSATWSRAASLSPAPTASSRSTITTSAPVPTAFANRSGRLPGTNSSDRADATTSRAVTRTHPSRWH